MDDNLIRKKSYQFGLRIVKLSKYLQVKKEYIMSNQILRSGTSIGANAYEAKYAQSRADFVSKMSISLKEASETQYWIDILHDSGYINDSQYQSLIFDVVEIIKLLTSAINTTKSNGL